jgi:hypothetical protein
VESNLKQAWNNAIKRFFTEHFISANIHVLADTVAVYYTFADCHFVLDLTLYQISRKLSWDGVKPAIIAFLADDPYVRQRFPWLSKIMGVKRGG